MNLKEILKYGKEELIKNNIEDASIIAKELAEHIFKITRAQMIANNDINLTSQEITRLRSEGGIKNNLNAFGLSVEKRVMESRLARLEREKKRIDRLKNKKGFVNLTQQIVKPIQMAHGMA